METRELPPLDDDFPAIPSETKSASVIDALRAQRSRIAETRSLDVDVPGWHDLLVLRLGSIEPAVAVKIAERSEKRKLSAHLANIDLLVAVCRGVYGRTPDDPELVQLVDEDGDPLGLDDRLAAMLDLGEVKTARDVVERLFARANSPTFAIGGIMSEWTEWAQGSADEIDEEFLGE